MKPGPAGRLKALCACGCGQRVKRHANRYASYRCVPLATRVAAAQKARQNFAYRRRAIQYREQVKALMRNRRIAQEDLLATFEVIYRIGYQAGYAVRQTRDKRKAAA